MNFEGYSKLELTNTSVAFIQSSINDYKIQRLSAWERNHNADLSSFNTKIAELEEKWIELSLKLKQKGFSGITSEILESKGVA